MFNKLNRIEELDCNTVDGVKRFIEDYINNSFIDLQEFNKETEEIIDIKVIPTANKVKILIFVGDK
jgi:hypothetical protein